MELTHADSSLIEIGIMMDYDQYDAISGLGSKYEDNDFELIVPEGTWITSPIEYGHYLYESGTEWGGRVENINHIGTQIKLSGPTWRGMLARKIISPPGGSAYLTITNQEANAALAVLIGSSLGVLFAVSTANSGITVSGSFRYTNLLAGIHAILAQYGARLDITFDGLVVTLAAIAYSDYTSTTEFSQDYIAPIESGIEYGQAYNHIIALGTGELLAREIVELWRTDAGTITATPQPAGLDDKQFVLDYPNAESTQVLTDSATAKLIEASPVEIIEIDLSTVETNLRLGDVVGGADQVTGLKISKQITQKILTVDRNGLKINYKAGE